MKKLSQKKQEEIKAIGFSVNWNVKTIADLKALLLDLSLIRIKLQEFK